MRVIVTRPGPQAGQWVNALREAGHTALALPLIEIGSPVDTQPVVEAWQRLQACDAVMFVSANAVAHFFALRPPGLAAPKASLRYWATGPGTVSALIAHDVPRDSICAPPPDAGQFDSEALWSVVADSVRPGAQVLIVRGASGDAADEDGSKVSNGAGRDWLANRLQSAGAQVAFVVGYARRAPTLAANAIALVQVAASDGSVWLFSSSEAVTNLQSAASGVHWGQARAIATHCRIAEAARAAGFGIVVEARPVMAELLASIESLA